MLKKAFVFVATHKLASVAFLIPVVGTVAAVAILAYQERQNFRKYPRAI